MCVFVTVYMLQENRAVSRMYDKVNLCIVPTRELDHILAVFSKIWVCFRGQ